MSYDPELTKTEGMLFELMWYGVISELRLNTSSGLWCCVTHYPADRPVVVDAFHTHEFCASTALGAYMEAFSFIMTRKLEGKPIYSKEALRKRQQLGLSF